MNMALKGELQFGTNNFGEQTVLSQASTIGQMIMNILLLRPGQMPGLPHIGIDIKSMLYKFEEDINVDDIKSKIADQCASLIPYINLGEMKVILTPYKNESILFIYIPLTILAEQKTVMIGFKKKDGSSDVTFNYQVTDAITTA